MKLLITILLLLIAVDCHGAAINAEQKYFRFYNDDGSTANNHTARTLENVNIGATPKGNIILRIELAFTGSIAGLSQRTLQVSIDGGLYSSVLNSTYLFISSTPSYIHGAATTTRLTPTGIFDAGQACEDSNITPLAISYVPGHYVEDQWCFQFTEAAVGHTFAFHSASAGPVGQSFTAVPTIKVNPAITIEGGPCFIEI